MNKSIKIILLVVAILLAVGGVMVYYKTIVSPPGKLVFKNQHIISIKSDISKVKSVNSYLALDATFVKIPHELDFQLANSYITVKREMSYLSLLQLNMFLFMFQLVTINLANQYGTRMNYSKCSQESLNYNL